jgi:hypothetical protein
MTKRVIETKLIIYFKLIIKHNKQIKSFKKEFLK